MTLTRCIDIYQRATKYSSRSFRLGSTWKPASRYTPCLSRSISLNDDQTFQRGALLPAVRAALALGCHIQNRSHFDRKHYFYADQPAGYQITQYYHPFATVGAITLHHHDGIASEDGRSVDIGIKQVQLEQDTAKTVLQPPSEALLDFNRVGHPLIEIITLPQIHHPQTAAACVKKIQALLQAVNAVTTGMELGGLRADVNVSVRRKGVDAALGQRTEIKNLSSIKAVEDAIVAERDRQIAILTNGGTIEGETRGWTLGASDTVKLRGKEGEVDYRYMPDPDLGPLIIGNVCIGRGFSLLLLRSNNRSITGSRPKYSREASPIARPDHR